MSDIKARKYTCSLHTHTHTHTHKQTNKQTYKLTSTGVFEADRSAPASPKGSKGSFLAVTYQMKQQYKLCDRKTEGKVLPSTAV